MALFANVVQYLPPFDIPVQGASPVPTAVASAPKDNAPENPLVRYIGEDPTLRELWVVTMHVHLKPTVRMIATAIGGIAPVHKAVCSVCLCVLH